MANSHLPFVVASIGVIGVLTACGNTTESPAVAPTPSGSVEGVVPVQVDPDASGADENGDMPALDVEEAAGQVSCGKPQYGSVICTASITNTTDRMGMITTDMAFYNADGVRIGTDGRYEDYVAPGETYVVQHYGPKKTSRADVLSVDFSEGQEITTTVAKQYGNYYLPPSNAKVGKCRMEYGNAVCKLTITNGGPELGEIDISVAFYDADGVRLDSETRYQEKVAPGTTYRQDFFGPKGTAGVKVLELELQPDK